MQISLCKYSYIPLHNLTHIPFLQTPHVCTPPVLLFLHQDSDSCALLRFSFCGPGCFPICNSLSWASRVLELLVFSTMPGLTALAPTPFCPLIFNKLCYKATRLATEFWLVLSIGQTVNGYKTCSHPHVLKMSPFGAGEMAQALRDLTPSSGLQGHEHRSTHRWEHRRVIKENLTFRLGR